MTYHYAITQDLDWQIKANWQPPTTPFMSFEYWQALIDTGAIGQQSGWVPLYIIISQEHLSSPIAVMPLFIKGHHQGEYVFDHAWAEAYARYGVDYYPRLVTSVPYTPVSGGRFWLAKDTELNSDIWQVAITAIDDVAKQIDASSWHGLFIEHEQIESALPLDGLISGRKLLERQGCQFLWENKNITNEDRPFSSFAEFLSTLTAKKRKNIRAERKKIPKQNIHCLIKTGQDITNDDWEVFYQCYAMTYAIRGRKPYLTPAFFTQLATTMSANLMLAQGVDETGETVASSLFFYDDPQSATATLYGRYWGALADFDSLHFELCYYQGIEFAIEKGLQYFDPGTQGEHKLIRGFVPTKTHSVHRIYDERFEQAIANFCQQDKDYMRQYRYEAHQALPFNQDNMPSFKG